MYLSKDKLWKIAAFTRMEYSHRSSRSRDEWESAALHNANTRANGLLPLWGPQVPESAFASCLARHNTYLQECTTHR